MPDYSFKKPAEPDKNVMKSENEYSKGNGRKLGTTISGLLGIFMVLALAYLSGFALNNRKRSL